MLMRRSPRNANGAPFRFKPTQAPYSDGQRGGGASSSDGVQGNEDGGIHHVVQDSPKRVVGETIGDIWNLQVEDIPKHMGRCLLA